MGAYGANYSGSIMQRQDTIQGTITYSYLEGNKESVDETIRAFIATQWDKTKTNNITPKFIPPHGIDDQESNPNKSKSANDWKYLENKNLIRFKVTDSIQNGPSGWNNKRISKIYIITMDIFALTPHLELLFSEEIENILFIHQPNNTTRIPKSNGTENSAISTFDRQSLDWITVGSFEDNSVTRQLTADIGCVIEKTKS